MCSAGAAVARRAGVQCSDPVPVKGPRPGRLGQQEYTMGQPFFSFLKDKNKSCVQTKKCEFTITLHHPKTRVRPTYGKILKNN
jgi:hypothetical protein